MKQSVRHRGTTLSSVSNALFLGAEEICMLQGIHNRSEKNKTDLIEVCLLRSFSAIAPLKGTRKRRSSGGIAEEKRRFLHFGAMRSR